MPRIDIQDNVALDKYTTFRFGGPARYFVKVKSIEELQLALDWAHKYQQKILVLAGGSNLIISSQGFDGLALQIVLEGLEFAGSRVIVAAGTSMERVVDATIERGLAGLEWAGGLPGSVGGAIRGNAGAFGGEIKDVVELVISADIITGKLRTRTNLECVFNYRESIFKIEPDEIIVSATLRLHPGKKAELREVADDHIRYRHERHPMEHPNAGSIFKNVPAEKVPKRIQKLFAASIKTDPFPVIPTAKIIAEAGLQGLKVGQAQVSLKHTNYMVNLGGATGDQVYRLIKKVQKAVKEKYGIELEPEPELVGF